jgi:hypothetical protein
MARYAKVEMSLELLAMFLKADWNFGDRITTNAPKDLKVIGISPVEGRIWPPRSVYILCESESFAEVPEGTDVPVINAFVSRIERVYG